MKTDLSASLFENIPWSTDQVLSATRKNLRLLNWQWSELRRLRDIDTPEDLEHFPNILRKIGLS